MNHARAASGIPFLNTLSAIPGASYGRASHAAVSSAFPDRDIDATRFACVRTLVALREELKEADISCTLLGRALHGEQQATDELCINIMDKLIERERPEAAGRSHLQSLHPGYSDGLIDFLVVLMIEAAEHYKKPLGPSLVVLLRDRLGGPNPRRRQMIAKRESYYRAIEIGAGMLAHGEEPSIRKIATRMNVNPTSVLRWFGSEIQLRAEIAQHVKLLETMERLTGLKPRAARWDRLWPDDVAQFLGR
jgi:hypothetical protein